MIEVERCGAGIGGPTGFGCAHGVMFSYTLAVFCFGVLQRPVLVVRVEESASGLRVFTLPIQVKSQGHKIGQKVVEFRDPPALRVVGG